MSISIAKPLARSSGSNRRILFLTILFGLFSYAFLAMRGAMIEEEWAMLLSLRRAIAVVAGAGAYWIVLKKLETLERIELGKVVGWIVMSTIAILIVRLAIDQFSADPLPPLRNIRWSLAWSGYFGLWVMGAIAFGGNVQRSAASPSRPRVAAVPLARAPAAEPIQPADIDWLIDAIAAETGGLSYSARREAAARIFTIAGYESADDADPEAARHNARVRLASRVAARLVRGG